jgi:long-chain acyl-CoA synthetase
MIAESQRRRLELTAPFANFKSTAGMFRSRLKEDAGRPAAIRKVEGRWVSASWAELAAIGEELAWGLLALGVEPREMVALIGATRLEWTFCDLGVMHSGAISVPIYHTSTVEETRFILEDAGAVVAFLENAAQLKKLQQIKERLPRLRRVVLMEGEGPPGDGWVLSLQQLRKLGVDQKA